MGRVLMLNCKHTYRRWTPLLKLRTVYTRGRMRLLLVRNNHWWSNMGGNYAWVRRNWREIVHDGCVFISIVKC